MRGVEIRVRGQVQGVGFRPFIWRLARARGYLGHVLNDPEGVLIRVLGDVGDFSQTIRAEAPPLARVDAVEVSNYRFATAPDGFEIVASQGKGAETRVTPDAATCPDCLAEIEGDGRRRHYAFTNCTHCGPRFTILNALPYDRAQTTMAPFEMCAACRAEYEDPADRRFHAQPIACPDCGPRVWLEEPTGEIREAANVGEVLKQGGIVAVKGLGGFHLACDATNAEAIEKLRLRKRRPGKPFALMADLETIRHHAEVSKADEELLCDASAPIVVLRKSGLALPDGLAPGQDTLGWMLPYTPLHHLLLREWARGPLVMTSGNLSGEPQVIDNEEARQKLAPFVDAYLMHDRDIARRLDDSVLRSEPRMVLRRARGRVPGTIALPPGFGDAPQILALGGQMKGAICLIKNGQALLSHHLGDLDDALCLDEFHKAIDDYRALFDHRTALVAVDAHPGYRASQAGHAMGLPVTEVCHHHGHLAACLAENGWPADGGPVAGIILDGTGLGDDGTVWGGELLLGDYAGYERVSHLSPVPMVGGDRAAREPWRNALMRLDAAGCAEFSDRQFATFPVAALRSAAKAGVNASMSSSAGRLFDAVAAILGICVASQSYEGEAAMLLEALAQGGAHEAGLPQGADGVIDPSAMVQTLVAGLQEGLPVADLAYAFHDWLATAFASRAKALVLAGKASAVALSGGCFQNALLHRLTVAKLEGIPVLTHRETPANDGGLALGQALIAAVRQNPGIPSYPVSG
ncbi:carbamoyltransferase HypF [Sinirhodobacter sp. WL0062]|uniref:Carbamoyltransferase HypF n=1 Tax=Rhodobacter flavimaris TaxID=2907145 RepID=A0ABS8YR53_9RHOB|nr:carbamoyltransferase HypF [Sinirhodobacter sp. WL0062]